MQADVFGAKPELLMKRGDNLIEQAEKFSDNAKKIFATVDEMITSNYNSPEAEAIANEIKGYQDELEAMQKEIDKYGKFCKAAGLTWLYT